MATPDVATATTAFELPPAVRNARGEVRKAGFELEYAGLSLGAGAGIVAGCFFLPQPAATIATSTSITANRLCMLNSLPPTVTMKE